MYISQIKISGLHVEILQYPRGGGHMSEHSDYILKNVSKINFTNNFYQLILSVTEKGKDFKKGGAFVIYKNKKILIEDMLRTADIIIYKSTIKHGVDEIDDDKKIDLNRINGRIILMNSLYQIFLLQRQRQILKKLIYNFINSINFYYNFFSQNF